MKIAVITDGIWPITIGGMQKHSYYLIKYLASIGHDISVYYPFNPKLEKLLNEIYTKEELDHINWVSVKRKNIIKFPGNYLVSTFLYSKNVSACISNRSFDIIYIQGLCGWGFLKSNKRANNAVTILNLHGLNMFQPFSGTKDFIEKLLFRTIALQLFKNSDYIQSLGGRLTELLEINNVSRLKILQFGIGISKSWLSEEQIDTNRSRTFVFIGRYDKVKGIRELHFAINKLIEESFDFSFHIIGDFPQEVKIQNEKVTYHGRIDDEKLIKNILDRSDILVLPSYSEGMPTVILEAMARYCAIIATDVGAVSELVTKDNGIIIEPHNRSELYSALINSIKLSNADLIKMQRNSRVFIEEKYLWNVLAIEMANKFEQLIKTKGRINFI